MAGQRSFGAIPSASCRSVRFKPTIDDFFNNRFGPMAPTAAVPVTRIDVSGYGASAISRWTNPNAAVVDVTRVQFDVLVPVGDHFVPLYTRRRSFPANAATPLSLDVEFRDAPDAVALRRPDPLAPEERPSRSRRPGATSA